MGPARQNGQPLLEPLEQISRGQRPDPGSGELDRKRQAVDAPADLADHAFVLDRELEVGLQRPSPLLEELDGGGVVERRDGEDMLAREVQNGSARHEQHQSRRAGEQLDESRGRRAQMLHVVEDEQELPIAHRRSERVQRRLARHLGDRHRARDRRQDQPGIAKGRELDDHSAVGEARRRLPGGSEREARLAAPSCAGEDEQPDVAARQERGQRIQIALAADKRVRRHGEHAQGLRQAGRSTRAPDPAGGCGGCNVAQLHTRLEPELVIQAAPQLEVAVECLRLPAGAVERQHRDALQTLPQGVVSSQRERLTEHVVVPAES